MNCVNGSSIGTDWLTCREPPLTMRRHFSGHTSCSRRVVSSSTRKPRRERGWLIESYILAAWHQSRRLSKDLFDIRNRYGLCSRLLPMTRSLHLHGQAIPSPSKKSIHPQAMVHKLLMKFEHYSCELSSQ